MHIRFPISSHQSHSLGYINSNDRSNMHFYVFASLINSNPKTKLDLFCQTPKAVVHEGNGIQDGLMRYVYERDNRKPIIIEGLGGLGLYKIYMAVLHGSRTEELKFMMYINVTAIQRIKVNKHIYDIGERIGLLSGDEFLVEPA